MRTVVEANQLQSLVTHRIVHNLLGLLHSHADVHSAIAVGLYAVPRQCLDIALSESREARKKESESINFNNAIEGRIGAQVSEQKALPTEELTEHDDTVGTAPQPKADDAVVKPVSEAEPKQEKIDLTSKTAPKGLTFKRKSILDSMQEKENK